MAGEEIDALLAERIMGWKVEKYAYPNGEEWYIPGRIAYIKVLPTRNGLVPLWKPTADPKAAWEVVEKLREMGWLVQVQATPDGSVMPESKKPVPAYMATAAYIKGRDSSDPAEIEKYFFSPYGFGETVSEAVCRMAVEMIRGIFLEKVPYGPKTPGTQGV